MKVVCLSDTHGQHEDLNVPNGKVVVHTGDFSNRGTVTETDNFLEWYASLPHQYKILVAGNHDWFAFMHEEEFKTKCHLLGIIYLRDEEITIEGVKFYGTPWVPEFCGWAFMLYEHDLETKYAMIPDDTQILLTHGPAAYLLDEVRRGHVGSDALAERLPQLTKLTHHVCGHIHESRGKLRNSYMTVNAACVGSYYEVLRPQSIYVKPNLTN